MVIIPITLLINKGYGFCAFLTTNIASKYKVMGFGNKNEYGFVTHNQICSNYDKAYIY